jgi:ABC-type branched-subunit amino acid transport system substrate-binding protein
MVASATLALAACGTSGGTQAIGQALVQAPSVADDRPATSAERASAPEAPRPSTQGAAKRTLDAVAAPSPARAQAAAQAAAEAEPAGPTAARVAAGRASKASGPSVSPKIAAPATAGTGAKAATAARDQAIYEQTNGATDRGVTKTEIKLGSVNMHAVALGNMFIDPIVRGNMASAAAINDRGGILGRRLSIVDCDDGTGEVARTKACIKKLVGQDKIFAMMTSITWGTASIHNDLAEHALPHLGAWAYSQTEWQDPYMFPTHMSMIHEAIANAQWVRDIIKPKTYGLICLTSPEMQLACEKVQGVLDQAGMKLVKKVDVGVSEVSMSPQVLSLRAANPDHIIHYVINPASMGKFMIEAAQQDYYPPMGISGNHLAAEVLGSLFGKHPVDRYWTNTTYKLWGPEFIATMNKYARAGKGTNHHIVQAGYVAMNMLAQAGREVGPNLTRERLIATLSNGTVWKADASLDQRFQYIPSERSGDMWSRQNGQGREFMYKYTAANTTANPDGTPAGFVPDDRRFVIHADH